MEYFHKLTSVDIDLEDAIERHSADKDIIYKYVGGEPIYMGYFFPKDYKAGKKYATFIFIHGGGWVDHKIFKDQVHWQGDYLGFLARYYADRGYLCISIDYRLAKECGQSLEYEVIDCYEDCCDAMDYILVHAEEYGIDTEQMYLLGESAGGHLAGAVATFHYDRMYTFKKIFLVNAITDMSDEKWNSRVPRKSMHKKLVDLNMKERAIFLSPLYQADEKMGETVLIHGEIDPIVHLEHSKIFHDKMQELSKKCELHIIEKTSHAFLLAEYVKDMTACKIGIDIMNQCLDSE